MSWLKKKQEARLEMIRAIAQSQHAMARILNSIADSAERMPILEQALGENIRILVMLQQTMAEQITEVPLRKLMFGIPAKPWLTKEVIIRKASGQKGGANCFEKENWVCS